MQTLMQTGKINQLEQEVYEFRGEVTTLRAEVEKLTSLVSSLMATKDPPLVQQRPQPLCQPMCTERPRLQALQQPIPQSCFPVCLRRTLFRPDHLLEGLRNFYCQLGIGPTSLVSSIQGHQVMTLNSVLLLGL